MILNFLDATLHFELVSRLNEIEVDHENSELWDFVLSLYPNRKIKKNKVHLLDPISKRKLNGFELDQFEIENFDDYVFIGLRISLENSIFHSINYKKAGENTSSYCIKYRIKEKSYFGLISYFIEIENFFYVVLFQLKTIKTCLFDDIKVRVPDSLQSLKRNKLFDNFFSVCEKTDDLMIINSNDIISKCIIYEESDEVYYLTDLLNENEHD